MDASARLSEPTCDPAQGAWLHLQLARHQPARLVLDKDARQDALGSGLQYCSRGAGRVQLNVQHAARVAGGQLLALQAPKEEGEDQERRGTQWQNGCTPFDTGSEFHCCLEE